MRLPEKDYSKLTLKELHKELDKLQEAKKEAAGLELLENTLVKGVAKSNSILLEALIRNVEFQIRCKGEYIPEKAPITNELPT